MEQGILPHSARGQHAKVFSWLDDKSIRMCCVSWLDRKKAFKRLHPKNPERHWLAADFMDHVNEVLENTTLLPEGDGSPKISLRTAMRWLVKLVGFKPFVLGVHDESTVHVHDTQKTSWEPEGEIRMRTKSSGSGIMISEIIFEKCRYLACDDTEWATFCAFDTFKPKGHEHCTS